MRNEPHGELPNTYRRRGVKKTLLSLLCISPLMWISVTPAQPVAQPGSITGDISAFHGDQNTLVNAIQATEQTTGGKVLDIRFSNANGVPAYNVVVLKGGQAQFFRIEEKSHHVIEIDASSTPVWMLSWRGKADVGAAKQARVSLSSAIRTAQQAKNGAPAAAAGIARSASNSDSDVHAYTVLLADHGQVRSVSVDSANGEVIADPSALNY
jgi:uncharacterized membrane protein YkoI